MRRDENAERYVNRVLESYLALPETPSRVSRWDRSLAHDLLRREVSLSTIEGAFLLASARRLCRPTEAPPLGPIRSLAYFLPVIDEVLHQPLPTDYLRYLKHKLATFSPKPNSRTPPTFPS